MTPRGFRLCGTSSDNIKWSGKILTKSQSLKLRQHGEQVLLDQRYVETTSRKHRIDYRTRRDKVHLRNKAFDAQMKGIMDAFLAWFSSLGDAGLANDNPAPSSSELQDCYPVEVLDVYTSSNRKVALRKGDLSVAAAFVCEGLIPCAPYLPTLAVTVRVLELYRSSSLCCPHLSINSFVKALCDLHGVSFRPYLHKQFSICYGIYLTIRLSVDQRIHVALKYDDPGWRLRHPCPACTNKLTRVTEPLLNILVTMDGNDSLKHIQPQKPAYLGPGNQ